MRKLFKLKEYWLLIAFIVLLALWGSAKYLTEQVYFPDNQTVDNLSRNQAKLVELILDESIEIDRVKLAKHFAQTHDLLRSQIDMNTSALEVIEHMIDTLGKILLLLLILGITIGWKVKINK